MNRQRWTMVVHGELICLYRGRKCVDVLTARDAMDEARDLLLLAESLAATAPYTCSDPGLRP